MIWKIFWGYVAILGRVERPLEWGILKILDSFEGKTSEPDHGARVAELFKNHTLYGFQFSWFTLKVRRELRSLSISLPLKDILEDSNAYRELIIGGKHDRSPCLRIDHLVHPLNGETEWMYGSNKIIGYLRRKAFSR